MPLPSDPPPTVGPPGTVPDGSLSSVESSSPHMVVYSVLDKKTSLPLMEADGIHPITWITKHPTADAAQAHISDIRTELRSRTGENPWAEAIKLSRAPNGSLIVTHQNLQMAIKPIAQSDHINKETIPHGDRYKFKRADTPGESTPDSRPPANKRKRPSPNKPVPGGPISLPKTGGRKTGKGKAKANPRSKSSE